MYGIVVSQEQDIPEKNEAIRLLPGHEDTREPLELLRRETCVSYNKHHADVRFEDGPDAARRGRTACLLGQTRGGRGQVHEGP